MSPSEPPPKPLPHIGPMVDDRVQRERFGAHELAMVISHYGLGVIEQIRVCPHGSRRAPKLRIKAGRGEFLLKRRALGRDDPYRVAFAHSLQLFLVEHGYPVPALIGTRQGNNSMLQLNGRIYEMFQYTIGTRYDGSAGATEQAGRALGALHRLLARYQPSYEAPVATFHAASAIDTQLAQIPDAATAIEPQADRSAFRDTCVSLRKAYREAGKRVDQTGFRSQRKVIIHGYWHPGNLLYRRGVVVAVLDFDSARLEPRIADIANAALQFSLTMPAHDDPADWPEGLDVGRIRRLVRGYDHDAEHPVRSDELAALPWLMIEALILESVVPIAATGSFGRIAGSTFLPMIERKIHWIAPRAGKIIRFLQEQR